MRKESDNGLLITLHQVARTYTMGGGEVHALAGIDLEIERGEYLAVNLAHRWNTGLSAPSGDSGRKRAVQCVVTL